MELPIILCFFVLGTVFVVVGGNLFVDTAGWIARAFGIPSFIIGATVVSLATTMPEMLVSLTAAAEGMADIAVGNAIGSVTANTSLILALSFLFLPAAVSRKTTLLPCLLLIFSAVVLHLGTGTGTLPLWGSLLLLGACAAFLIFSGMQAKEEGIEKREHPPKKGMLVQKILLFLLGAAGIVLGSQWMVTSGSGIAKAMGVPERIIAITLIAVGTSLPELVTTLAAISKKEAGLSAGNIIGANILDLTVILPLCSLVSKGTMTVSEAARGLDIPLCLGTILLAALPMVLFQRVFRLQGVMLLGIYAWYIFYLL